MRRAARIALAIVVLLVATIVLPRPAVRNVVPDAVAQVLPTPTLPNPLQSPTPKDPPTPKETPTPPPPDDDDNGNGGNNGG